ncbi:hypothetical protein [Pseudonocardia adelaidensis]|uniref:hypothetical protein n=1 Tax=Pseudonocardia adelaidensis TaxID=648754 RepID=UPI0031EE2296
MGPRPDEGAEPVGLAPLFDHLGGAGDQRRPPGAQGRLEVVRLDGDAAPGPDRGCHAVQ